MKPKIYTRSEHIVSRKNIDLDALKIMHRLIRSGYKGYLVGGGVRDLLLERKPKDFDIATDATPRQVKALFRNSRIIGRRFKLAHIFFKDNKIIEVSTFRDSANADENDVKTLQKDNIYGTEATDALRRDITINALYYDLNTFSIIDYVGGFKDLQKKIVRIIGNPTVKIIEDPVRMWRAIRHAAKCGFKLESESKKAIITNKELLKQIPTMRIHDELKKDFCSGYSYEIFKLAEKLKVLDLILPEISKPSTNLSNEENETSLALMFIDNWIKKGCEIPITAVLTVFSISVKKAIEKSKHYNELFSDEEEIDEFLKTLFTKFFVPKKEKEIIASTIKLWKKIISKNSNEISARSIARRASLEELKYLVWFTNNDQILMNTINEALKLKADKNKIDIRLNEEKAFEPQDEENNTKRAKQNRPKKKFKLKLDNKRNIKRANKQSDMQKKAKKNINNVINNDDDNNIPF